jgi:hypothetical protein
MVSEVRQAHPDKLQDVDEGADDNGGITLIGDLA